MAKKYTLTVEDYRGYFNDQDYKVKSLVNTVSFKIGDMLSKQDIIAIIDDENATVKIVARS